MSQGQNQAIKEVFENLSASVAKHKLTVESEEFDGLVSIFETASPDLKKEILYDLIEANNTDEFSSLSNNQKTELYIHNAKLNGTTKHFLLRTIVFFVVLVVTISTMSLNIQFMDYVSDNGLTLSNIFDTKVEDIVDNIIDDKIPEDKANP